MVEVEATGSTLTWVSPFLGRYQDGRTDLAFDVDEPEQRSLGARLELQPMATLAERMDTPLPLGAATLTP